MKLRQRTKFLGRCVMVLGALTAMQAQLSDLPIKAGLWETQVSLNHAAPVTQKACFTAGTTLGDYLTASNKGAPGVQCSVTNKVASAHGIVFDNECTSPTLSTKGHIDFQSMDAEHFSGSSHTTVSGNSGGRAINMTMDKTFTAKFVGTDCGAVKPMVVAGPGK